VNNAAELAALNAALSSPTATASEVQAAVGDLLNAGVSGSQAAELATNPKVLASIDSKQAKAIFKKVPVSKLDQEQEAALVASVSAAPQGVKNAFEGSIDVYGAGLDRYVPVGSVVDVGDRRTLIAAAAVTAVAGAAAAGSVSSRAMSSRAGAGDDSGGSGPTVPTGADTLNEAQMASVARRMGRGMMKKRSDQPNRLNLDGEEDMADTRAPLSKIFKRLVRETAAIGFTIAGGVVVIFTLSGDTRKVAMIALGTAFVLHVAHVVMTTSSE
jgi:hypothetical protein